MPAMMPGKPGQFNFPGGGVAFLAFVLAMESAAALEWLKSHTPMPDHCIVHFGPPKTGSTSIQQTLFHELTDPAFAYPKMGGINHHVPFERAFAGVFSGDAERQLESAIGGCRASQILFSSEGISWFQEEALERIGSFLRKHFNRITLAGYVRPPAALLQSSFQERLKVKPVPLIFDRLYQPYRRKFEKFDRVFGVSNVRLWRYDAADFPNGDVVQHFFEKLGIASPQQFRRVNESLPKPVVQVLYAFHKYGRAASDDYAPEVRKARLMKVLHGLKGEVFRFSPGVVRPVLAAHRDDIAWMESRLGASLDEPDWLADGAVGSEDDLLAINPEIIAALEARVAMHGPVPANGGNPARHAAALVAALLAVMAPRPQERATPAEGP